MQPYKKTIHPNVNQKEPEKPKVEEKEPEKLKVEENQFFGSIDGFKVVQADIAASQSKMQNTNKNVVESIAESTENIEKKRQMQKRIIGQIEDEDAAAKIIDATIDETFDQKLRFDTLTGIEAVKIVSLWLYTNTECKQHFREYNSIKSEVAYYLSKSVTSVVHEGAPVKNFFVNLITPGSKHYFSQPALQDGNKDEFIAAVKNECKLIDTKYKIKK